MGNRHQVKQKSQSQIFDALKIIMLHKKMNFIQKTIEEPLTILMHDIKMHHPFSQESDGILKVRGYLIRMFYCPQFPKQLLKLFKHLLEKLESVNSKPILLVAQSQIQYLTTLVNFLLFSSNESVLALFDSLTIRSDIDESSIQILKEIEARENQFEICENLVERLAYEELEAFEKILRASLSHFISSRQQTLSRSSHTLAKITQLEQSLFMLYTKLYFAPIQLNREDEISQRELKEKLTIGAYFLGCGNNNKKPSIFQMSIIFIYSLFNKMGLEEYKTLKAPPSHLFRDMPVFPIISLYQFIVCTILNALIYVREGSSMLVRFHCNRIQALNLVQKIITKFQLHNPTTTYYIEKLCIQVKIGQIQRACLLKITKQYLRNLNADCLGSQIMSIFLKTSNLDYKLKMSGKDLRVSSAELLSELEETVEFYEKQYILYGEKYLYESIIMQPTGYLFNDYELWDEILPSLLQSKLGENRPDNKSNIILGQRQQSTKHDC